MHSYMNRRKFHSCGHTYRDAITFLLFRDMSVLLADSGPFISTILCGFLSLLPRATGLIQILVDIICPVSVIVFITAFKL